LSGRRSYAGRHEDGRARTAIARAFALDHDELDGYPDPPGMRLCEHATAYDPTRIPDVPPAEIRVDRDSPHPGSILGWKVEYNEPRCLILGEPTRWLRDVVRPGYAVLDERPVIQILERDDTGSPTRILTTAVSGLYDTLLHGGHGAET
jgi:hypothetical protein